MYNYIDDEIEYEFLEWRAGYLDSYWIKLGGVVNTVKAYKELKDRDKAFMDGNTLYAYDVKENN